MKRAAARWVYETLRLLGLVALIGLAGFFFSCSAGEPGT